MLLSCHVTVTVALCKWLELQMLYILLVWLHVWHTCEREKAVEEMRDESTSRSLSALKIYLCVRRAFILAASLLFSSRLLQPTAVLNFVQRKDSLQDLSGLDREHCPFIDRKSRNPALGRRHAAPLVARLIFSSGVLQMYACFAVPESWYSELSINQYCFIRVVYSKVARQTTFS